MLQNKLNLQGCVPTVTLCRHLQHCKINRSNLVFSQITGCGLGLFIFQSNILEKLLPISEMPSLSAVSLVLFICCFLLSTREACN